MQRVQKELLRHADRVKGLYTLTADSEAAEDCFQEVFIVAVEKAGDFEQGTNFLPGLHCPFSRAARIEERSDIVVVRPRWLKNWPTLPSRLAMIMGGGATGFTGMYCSFGTQSTVSIDESVCRGMPVGNDRKADQA